jgi:hypothetical protein
MKLDEIMDRIREGDMDMFMWGALLLFAGFVFVISSVLGWAIFGSFINGILVGLPMTIGFGVGYVLYKAGYRFF